MKKGTIASIYRDDYSCILNKFNDMKRVLVYVEGGVFEPSPDIPAVTILKKVTQGGEYIYAVPEIQEAGEYFAFGGSFIYDSDSRFGQHSKYPIPLHDRRMNLEH